MVIELEEDIYIKPKFWFKDLFFIGISLFFLFFSLILISPFGFPDVIRYVTIPQQMVTSGEWLRTYFEDVPNLSGAPIYYWLQATAISIFGFNSFALKFWSAIFAIIGCLATYPLARIYFGRRCAVICCYIMATSAIYFTFCHVIGPYMVASTLFSLTFLSYLYAWLLGGFLRYCFKVMFWVLLAICGLSIGLSGILLPLLVLLIHHLMFRRMQMIRPMFSIVGVLLFAIIISGWIYIGYQYLPNFASTYFLQYNAFSLLDTSYTYSKMLLIIPVLFLTFLPWSVFLINALRISFPKSWKNHYDAEPSFFFVTWAIVVLIELGITVSPVAWLITISVPINILVARYFSLLWDRKTIVSVNLCYDIIMYIAFMGTMIVLGMLYFNWFRSEFLSIPYIQLLAIIFLAIALVVIPVMRHRSFPAGFVMLFSATLACLITLSYCYQYIGNNPNSAPKLLDEYSLKLSQHQEVQAPRS